MAATPSINTPVAVMRPAGERFHSQFDWLDSWPAFHSGPSGSELDGLWPLRVSTTTPLPLKKGPAYPHRDMEIITVMVDVT